MAAWAVSVGSYDLAIEWLEEGRSIVWSQILQLRMPFDDLFAVNQDLAGRLKDTASQLEVAGSRPSSAGSHVESQADLESQAAHHRKLAYQWEELLAEVRRIPGFQNFLLPRKAEELKKAATTGPIVMINTHPDRCDALIIFPQRDDVVHVPLRTSSLERLIEIHAQMIPLVGRGRDATRARGFKRDNPTRDSTDELRPLASLWSDIVSPVLDTIKHNDDSVELPHITWCTTGPLAFLPLHAAGLYNGVSPNVFDLAISSYAPTLGSLIAKNHQDLQGGVLGVGQKSTLGQPSLPKTVDELAFLQKYANVTRYCQLDDDLATVEATLDAMDQHGVVHLACHAIQDSVNPSHSAFYLHDGTLTLEDIAKRAYKNKGLAFLSACQTATGDVGLPDEATHLAAGMLMAGYPSVIATMWSIMDDDAPVVTKEVYSELTKDGKIDHRNAARALHKAVGKLREQVGVNKVERWAPFIHIGA